MSGLVIPPTTALPLRPAPRAVGLVIGAPAGAPATPMVAAAVEALELPPEPVLTVVRDVELLYAGTWATSTGMFTWEPHHLRAAVAAQDDDGYQTPVLKIGHAQPAWMDAEPSLGIIRDLRVNANATTLLGDLVGVPGWLATVMAFAWPDRSIEGFFDWNDDMRTTHAFVLTALSLLGVIAGAVTRLADLPALFAASPPPGTTVAGTPWEDVPVAT